MEVYIEYVIIDNLIINIILLLLTLKTLKSKAKKLNIFLSASVGMVFAIIFPTISFNTYLLFVLKLLVGVLMVLMLKKPRGFKHFIVTYLLFLTYTFILGGICFGIMFMFNFNTSINGIIINGFELPVSIFILIIAFYIYLLFKLIETTLKKQLKQKQIYSLVIKQNNKSYNLEGFLDSGNHLYYNGQPIIIVSQKTFSRLFSKISYDKILLQRVTPSDIKGAAYITASSISGTKKILVFNVEEIYLFINNKLKIISNAAIGLANSNFNNEFDCLLHPDLF